MRTVVDEDGEEVSEMFGISTQSCGALMPLQPPARTVIEYNDEGEEVGREVIDPPDDNTLKYGVTYKVTSGWKTWDSAESDQIKDGRNGMGFEIQLWSPTRYTEDRGTVPAYEIYSPISYTDEFGYMSAMTQVIPSVAVISTFLVQALL